MFNSGVLDVAVGLLVVFILVSTVCSAIREAIESRLKTRAAYLEYAIRELLNDREGKGLARSFFEHPLIHSLYQKNYEDFKTRAARLHPFTYGGDMPSYIPARSFATALIDIVGRRAGASGAGAAGPVDITALRDNVRRLPNPYIQAAMLSAIDAARGDMAQVRAQLQDWFDTTMDRVSGWYKRSTQTIIFIIAIVVSGALNLDALAIADTLYRDQTTRAALVAAAERLTPEQTDGQVALQNLEALRLPIGWSATLDSWEAKRAANTFSIWNDLVMTLFGLLLTAFAATLGAPFWFDVLNRVMVIRATVKPHEKSPEEASEDRQLGEAAGSHRAASPVIQVVTGETKSFRAAVPDNDVDVDDCDLGDDHPTPDEALPAASGGVSS